MTVPEVRDLRWRKSRFSDPEGTGNCVEVAAEGGVVFVRDSKDAGGELLDFTTGAWQHFLRGAGRL
jgi:hypothetical protein